MPIYMYTPLDQPIKIHCLVESSRNLLKDVMGPQQLRIYVETLCYFEIQKKWRMATIKGYNIEAQRGTKKRFL